MPDVPLTETLAAVNQLYRADKFKRFGLSNYTPEQVEEVIRVASENNYVQPTVYQGTYSAISRKLEAVLFPTLRKYNIIFYAYSPISGGLLAKTKEQIINPPQGRWHPSSTLGKLSRALYDKPSFLAALDTWG